VHSVPPILAHLLIFVRLIYSILEANSRDIINFTAGIVSKYILQIALSLSKDKSALKFAHLRLNWSLIIHFFYASGLIECYKKMSNGRVLCTDPVKFRVIDKWFSNTIVHRATTTVHQIPWRNDSITDNLRKCHL